MTAAAKRGQDRVDELREALAMPGWRVPDYGRVSDQYSDRLNVKTALDELFPLIHQHIHAGRMEDAAEVLLLLAEAARRESGAASLEDRLVQGLALQNGLVHAVLPFLEAATPDEETLCLKLQEACRRQLVTADRIKACLLRDIEFRCHDLMTLPRRERVPEKDWPESRGYRIGAGFRRFFLNSKATANRCRRSSNRSKAWQTPIPAGESGGCMRIPMGMVVSMRLMN
jgi:hypothetical protein